MKRGGKEMIEITEALLKSGSDLTTFEKGKNLMSNAVRNRFFFENGITAEVEGNRGLYNPIIIKEKDSFFSICTCKSSNMSGENRFCKHSIAVGIAYIEEPDSFKSLSTFSERLERYEKRELIRIIENAIKRLPGLLPLIK